MFGVVFATGTLLVSLWVFPPPEGFPVIAILNESYQAGPYPTSITQYTNISLNIEVDNFMGTVQYFHVRTKLATANTMTNATHPSSAPLLAQYQRVLCHGESWIFPIQLNMTTSGINFWLTFELWRYDPYSEEIIWVRNSRGEGIWIHLPLNVTAS